MGRMARATLTAGAALVLSMARGFLLPLPRSVPIYRQTFPAPTTATTTAAAGSSRIPYARPTSAFTGCAKSLRATSRRSEASVLSPRCPGSGGSDLGGNLATTMRLGTGVFMPAGAARKLAFVGLANTAAFSTVGGGLLAGGLHAISGPDHLAALLPRIMGKKWHSSMRIGATWGLGHGFSATVIGLAVRESYAFCSKAFCLCEYRCLFCYAAVTSFQILHNRRPCISMC